MFLSLIDVFFLFKFQDGIDKPQKCQNVYAITQRTSSKVTFLILVLYDFIVQNILSSLLLLASKVVRLLFAQRFITIFNCRHHTSNHLSVCHKPTSLSPINCQSVDNCCIITMTQFTWMHFDFYFSYLLTLPLCTEVSRVRALSPAWTGSPARETLISRTISPQQNLFSRFWGSLPFWSK
jgi:hypothetical protein